MVVNPENISTENINEVILRLLKLNPGIELDYQTYAEKIKKKLFSKRLISSNIPVEEDILLREEFKRVKNKKGRFKVKVKTARVSTSPPSSSGSSPSSGGGTPPKGGKIIKSPKGEITKGKKISSENIKFVTVKDVTEKVEKVSKKENPLEKINKTLDSILQTITNLNKEDQKEKERKRKEDEKKRRDEKERGLESKSFAGIRKAVSAITKPFQSIFDKIFNFIFYTLLGRVVMKLIDWFADPKNKDKVNSLIRFVKDWWPALLGSYILFGTSFGGLVRGLTGMVGRFIFQLGKVAIPKLLSIIAANPLKSLLISGAAAAGWGAYTASQQNEQRRDEFKKSDPNIVTPRETKEQGKSPGASQLFQEQTLQRGFAMFNGGGYANYGNLFRGIGGAAVGAGLGSMFGPLGMLLGAGIGGAASSGFFNGFVKGPKGRDKVPAMLTDGEFVMSTGAVQKYGVDTLEAMNAAGGGTNQPKVVGDMTYAATGGLVGNDPRLESGARLRPNAKSLRFSTLWHGTNDIFKRMIESGGIDPKKFTFGALGEGFYTTPDKKIAQLYAQETAKINGGKPEMIRLRVPTDVLKKYSANINQKGLQLSGNELIQYSNRFRPYIGNNTRMSSMYVWGGRGQITPEGFGPRIGNVGKGGLSMAQQYQAANLANRFGSPFTPSTIRSSLAPQRWRQRFVPRTGLPGQPQSFTQSARDASGLTELERRLRFEEKISPRYGQNLPQLRAIERTAKIGREPIPASRAIVPYRGGGLVRSGITGGLSESIPQIRPNMKIPGGFGNLKTFGLELLLNYLMQKGIDKATSLILTDKIQKGKRLKGNQREDYIEKLRNVIDNEENWQRGYGGLWDKIIGLGRESSSEKKSNFARAILEGIGSAARKGGRIMGGYRIREQSFRDAPKTQIMLDDKGVPFIGYKALRNGKLHYVRGPQPGGRTSNPLEALGRMINPNAYRDIDTRNRRRQYEEAYRNSISSLRTRGAAQPTISRAARRLRFSGPSARPGVSPPPRRRRGYVPAGGAMGGRRGSGSNPSVRQNAPGPSPRHSRGFRSASAYGIYR